MTFKAKKPLRSIIAVVRVQVECRTLPSDLYRSRLNSQPKLASKETKWSKLLWHFISATHEKNVNLRIDIIALCSSIEILRSSMKWNRIDGGSVIVVLLAYECITLFNVISWSSSGGLLIDAGRIFRRHLYARNVFVIYLSACYAIDPPSRQRHALVIFHHKPLPSWVSLDNFKSFEAKYSPIAIISSLDIFGQNIWQENVKLIWFRSEFISISLGQ